MGEMSFYLSCQDTSPDMEHDLPGSFIRSGRLTGLRSNFKLTFWGQNAYLCFDAPRPEEYDGVSFFYLPQFKIYLQKR